MPPCAKIFAHVPPARCVARSFGCSSSAFVADSPGGTPPLHAEIAAALYGSGSELRGHVYGLGGRDFHPADVRALFAGDREEAPWLV